MKIKRSRKSRVRVPLKTAVLLELFAPEGAGKQLGEIMTWFIQIRTRSIKIARRKTPIKV